jgi:glutamine amidotransferase
MIAIIDYGMGNLGSVYNMFKYIGVAAKITSDFTEIKGADKILLPGVGSFDKAMERINSSGLREILDEHALIKAKPILGICLGMQLLTRGSEEGKLKGLGWIDADTVRFPVFPKLRVPHMGWNLVFPHTSSALTKNLPTDSRFYFVHSFKVHVDIDKNSVLKVNYGGYFDAAIQKNNIYGAQFHPEKSHKYGMQLLENFARHT